MKPVALKLHTYETIYRLNRAFELVRLNLERLAKSGLFRREFVAHLPRHGRRATGGGRITS